MKVLIAAIGKLRAGPEATLVEDYLARARNCGRNIGFSGPLLTEMEAPNNLQGDARQVREGDLLLKSARDFERLIILDETGVNLSSAKFAKMMREMRDQGIGGAAFLIGGADGHGEKIKTQAAQTLSFGAATWPHMMARAMLAEQIYRAMTILSGHPYHRS